MNDLLLDIKRSLDELENYTGEDRGDRLLVVLGKIKFLRALLNL